MMIGQWFKAATIRAIKTGAQCMSGYIGAATAFDEVNWTVAFGGSGLAIVGVYLLALAGLPEVS